MTPNPIQATSHASKSVVLATPAITLRDCVAGQRIRDEAGNNRPTLSLGFKAADGSLVEQTRPTHVRLPPFFSNLLPEAHLREYLAARGGIHPDCEFFLMWLLGADLPGAIEVRSIDGTSPPAVGEESDRSRRDDQPFRFSLAGVQLKFSAL
jgi:serine/threonine-protein kinase HipA